MLLKVGHQFVSVGRPRFSGTQGVQLQGDVLHQAKLLPQACREQDDFGIDVRAIKAVRLYADLMELAITPFLRPFVAEHRPLVPKPLSLVMQQAVFHSRPHAAGSAFRAQRQAVTVAVVEGVHLFLDDIGDFANRAGKQRRLFHDRRTNFIKSVAVHELAYFALKKLPARAVAGQ